MNFLNWEIVFYGLPNKRKWFFVFSLIIDNSFLTVQFSFWQNRSFTLLSLYTDQLGEPSERCVLLLNINYIDIYNILIKLSQNRCGDINFSLEYDFSTQTLKLKIHQVVFTLPSGKNISFLSCEWVEKMPLVSCV